MIFLKYGFVKNINNIHNFDDIEIIINKYKNVKIKIYWSNSITLIIQSIKYAIYIKTKNLLK